MLVPFHKWFYMNLGLAFALSGISVGLTSLSSYILNLVTLHNTKLLLISFASMFFLEIFSNFINYLKSNNEQTKLGQDISQHLQEYSLKKILSLTPEQHIERHSAITQQIKPDVYPNVDDEATIILTYKKAQVIIEASWNWPYSRKDMQVYGIKGYVFCKNGTDMTVKENENKEAEPFTAQALPSDRNDPFIYLKNVIRGNIKPIPFDLSTSANNEIVVKILEAAKQSAKTGRTILWDEFYKK